jgi:hypothetical protein
MGESQLIHLKCLRRRRRRRGRRRKKTPKTPTKFFQKQVRRINT